MEQHGKGVRDLVKATGLSKSTISNRLSGNQVPDRIFVERILDACAGSDLRARGILAEKIVPLWAATRRHADLSPVPAGKNGGRSVTLAAMQSQLTELSAKVDAIHGATRPRADEQEPRLREMVRRLQAAEGSGVIESAAPGISFAAEMAIGVLLAVVVGALGLWLAVDYGDASVWDILVNQGLGLCCCLGGIAVWRTRPLLRTGPRLMWLSVAILVSNLEIGLKLYADLPGRELIVLVGIPAQELVFALAGRLLLGQATPSGEPQTRAERMLVRIGLATVATGATLLLLTMTPLPTCHRWCGPSPLQLFDDPHLYLFIRGIVSLLWIALAAFAGVLLAHRLSRMSDRDRRMHRFGLYTAMATLVIFASAQLGLFFASVAATSTIGMLVGSLMLALAGQAMLVALPVSVVIDVLNRHRAFAGLGALAGSLERQLASEVQESLRRHLRDPAIRLVFKTAADYTDIYGDPLSSANGMALTPLCDPPIAFLAHDATLTNDPQLLKTAANIARIALFGHY